MPALSFGEPVRLYVHILKRESLKIFLHLLFCFKIQHDRGQKLSVLIRSVEDTVVSSGDLTDGRNTETVQMIVRILGGFQFLVAEKWVDSHGITDLKNRYIRRLLVYMDGNVSIVWILIFSQASMALSI